MTTTGEIMEQVDTLIKESAKLINGRIGLRAYEPVEGLLLAIAVMLREVVNDDR